ncbi:multidrug resistance-associated protein 1-like isoform X2 [Planococcus citri]|uniref:multidrug resistance-associated protein 1-like isoform X2 n=1 Tax=Planococcus citri TaxID=170843 RepID=UPI0031F7F521
MSFVSLDESCGSPFWDSNLTWYAENPDFTECFKKTALIWIPCIYLWICIPFEFYFLTKSNYREIPWNRYNITKLTFIFLMIAEMLIEYVESEINETSQSQPPIYVYSSASRLLSLILFAILTVVNIKMGIRSSGILFGYSVILTLCSIPEIRTIASNREPFKQSSIFFQFLHSAFRCIPPIVIVVLNCFADSKPKYSLCEQDENQCPDHEAPFISKLYLHWFEYYVWRNYKKPIQDVLWNVKEEDKTCNLSLKFENYFYGSSEPQKNTYSKLSKKEFELVELDEKIAHETNARNPSIAVPLFKMFWFDFLEAMMWKFLEMVSVIAYPLIFSLFLTLMADKVPSWKGYVCSFLFLLNGCLQAVALNKMYIKLTATQAKTKSTLMSAVYKKSLKISNDSRRKYTSGEIVNLMAVDTEKVSSALKGINQSWTSPIQVVLSIYFIWNILGPSVLASFVVIIILLPLINLLIKKMKLLQRIEMKNKDKRGKFMQEVLAGIKVLKMYAWESYFEKEVSNLRKKELKTIKTNSFFNAFLIFTFTCIPFLISAATFATYLISDVYHTLDVQKAFVTISFFNALRNPLQTLPDAISNMTQALISIKRINVFLSLQELDTDVISHDNTEEAIVIKNGSFSWTEDADVPTLKNLNIRIKESSIVSVIGSVGSGKSSLISALLGEMYKMEGYVNTKGKIAYVSQQAWILNATIKDNITLGTPVNQSLYEKALEACALETDLATMSDYDQTEIGEKGINLSGGQKQRISLARAICYDADIYLLDDPLSAVDSHIAKHIFQNVFGSNGVLKNKTRLLITHTTAFLSLTDFVIILENGSILESGTYQQLSKDSQHFNEFLRVDEAEIIAPKRNETQIIRRYGKYGEPFENSKPKPADGNTKKLIEREHLESGNVKNDVYTFYLSSIGVFFVSGSLFMYALCQVLSISSNLWLLKWSRDGSSLGTNNSQSTADKYFYFEIYLALGISEALTVLMANLIVFHGLLKASSLFHDTLVASILKWPTWLLDSTPIGRIINRLTGDIYNLDSRMGAKIVNLIIFLSRLISICLVIIYTTPICMVVMVPILIVMYLIQVFYSRMAHQITRIQAAQQSPLYSCLVETISGLPSVRAYQYENTSILRALDKMDRFSVAYRSYFICCRCIATKMDILGGCIGFFAAYFIVSEKNNLDIGLIGFSMSYSIQMTRELTWLLLRLIEIEDGIIAVERIKEYLEKPQEAAQNLPTDNKLESWPARGKINLQNYNLRYRQDLDIVLKNISFEIKSGEKVGIVGRTGAGKTSLILGLFRLIEPASGKILIDDVDISTIGLHLLRSRLTLIPQDPVLFLGTLRFNIDPVGTSDDETLWNILEKSHLKNFVQNLPGGLQYLIEEGGGNISYGQKQLICLARALLRKTKILILDEATASVDLETDELVQRTIRTEFVNCTVLTIAHRLNTVQDYDKILVINEGRVAEFDTPENLMKSENSTFYGMVHEQNSAQIRKKYA